MISEWLSIERPRRWIPEFRRPRSGAWETLTPSQLRERTGDLRSLVVEGQRQEMIFSELFPLVAEAARRVFGYRPRHNQFLTARSMLSRTVVELPTGEGKTLAAVPALAFHALAGRGAWLATANDYLAKRDALQMGPVFEQLGLTTGYVQGNQSPDERRQAYACDITYGTIREFGFDFLRDRLNRRRAAACATIESRALQRELHAIIVDEADSILLDDARTPLIISEPRRSSPDDEFRWSDVFCRTLAVDADYFLISDREPVVLTRQGRAKIRSAVPAELLRELTLPQVYQAVCRALQARSHMIVNRDYLVRDGEIVIIDRSTGRLAEGREWQNGIQQSLQAAHRLEITPETHAVAQVTIQAFLRMFRHLSGMTGTAAEARREFRGSYGLSTVVVPPFRACRREARPTEIHRGLEEKWRSIVSVVQREHAVGRPILIGTRDLDSSDELSQRLRSVAIPHQVLTARQEATEAELIAAAGHRHAVTVSTAIAGRGTDIRLQPGTDELGGLLVIAADLFDAARIDRQLAGRGGRQGSAAGYQQILSLEDGLLTAAQDQGFRSKGLPRVMQPPFSSQRRLLRQAQVWIESRQAQARRQMLFADRERHKQLAEVGLDPYLDALE